MEVHNYIRIQYLHVQRKRQRLRNFQRFLLIFQPLVEYVRLVCLFLHSAVWYFLCLIGGRMFIKRHIARWQTPHRCQPSQRHFHLEFNLDAFYLHHRQLQVNVKSKKNNLLIYQKTPLGFAPQHMIRRLRVPFLLRIYPTNIWTL